MVKILQPGNNGADLPEPLIWEPEYCPHSENEIEMRWDTDARGFRVFCPVCGERLMLCDECLHAGGTGNCDYNSETDSCRCDPQLAPK